MLNSIHTAVGNLDGFIQSDKRCLQTEKNTFLINKHEVGSVSGTKSYECIMVRAGVEVRPRLVLGWMGWRDDLQNS